MKQSPTTKTSFQFSKPYKAMLIGFYALAFYFAPVFSSAPNPNEVSPGGHSNHILIALFNRNFEFGDY